MAEPTKEYVEYLEAQVDALRAEVKLLKKFRDDIIAASKREDDEDHP